MAESEASKRVRGSLKEALGKIAGDPDVEAQGRAEKTDGHSGSAGPVTSRPPTKRVGNAPKS